MAVHTRTTFICFLTTYLIKDHSWRYLCLNHSYENDASDCNFFFIAFMIFIIYNYRSAVAQASYWATLIEINKVSHSNKNNINRLNYFSQSLKTIPHCFQVQYHFHELQPTQYQVSLILSIYFFNQNSQCFFWDVYCISTLGG